MKADLDLNTIVNRRTLLIVKHELYMKIPSQLHPYASPTAVVVSDTTKAKIFLCNGRNFNLIETIKCETERSSDKEAYSAQTSRSGGKVMMNATSSTKDYEWEEHTLHDHLYTPLSVKLMDLLNDGLFNEIIIAAPKDELNHLLDRLSPNLRGLVVLTITKNLAGFAEDELAAVIDASVGPK